MSERTAASLGASVDGMLAEKVLLPAWVKMPAQLSSRPQPRCRAPA